MIEIRVRPGESVKQLARLLKEWQDRTRALLDDVPRVVAEHVETRVLSKVPQGTDWKAYRKAFRVDRIVGLSKDEGGWIVRATPRSKRVSRVDAQKLVLYVEPRRRQRRLPEEIAILARFSPWTLDTLPFAPKKADARLVSRRVHVREVQRVAKQRRRDEKEWRPQLAKAGVRGDKKKKAMPSVRAAPDIAFEALRLELGLGGMKPRPHWRPAVRRVLSGFLGIARSQKAWVRTMMDPMYRGWKRPVASTRMSASQLGDYFKFQKTLGIRA